MTKLEKALADPGKALRVVLSLGKGYWFKLWYQHILKKATFGKNFKVDGWLSIKGPGSVHFGDNVHLDMLVTPWTFAKNAFIHIGNGTYLNGTRFACASGIYIGKNCIMADCRIMDTDFHGVHPNYRDVSKTADIIIEDNVWITIQSVVLKGSYIGTGSTISPNSVVTGTVPRNVVAGGNPLQILREFDDV